jgi:hypothetical protein
MRRPATLRPEPDAVMTMKDDWIGAVATMVLRIPESKKSKYYDAAFTSLASPQDGRSTREPSFVERARQRWKKGTGGGGDPDHRS